MQELAHYSDCRFSINGHGYIIGQSQPMLNLFQYLELLTDRPTTVLVRGETGTGKELVARALHFNRRNGNGEKPFVAVNCAGIPESLLESELFGYVRGAFTGAVGNRQGKFEAADQGTIFLDEIGDMSFDLQAKILRVLQDGEITPVGSNDTRRVNVRVVAATNQDLEAMIKNKKFREDLFYRLNVFPIHVPPLRKRIEDIPLLTQHFVERYNRKYGVFISGLREGAIRKLEEHSWKGNIRELENIIERAFVLRSTGSIEEADILFDNDLKEGVRLYIGDTETHLPEWCKRGVLPISSSQLFGLNGVYSKPHLLSLIRSPRYFTFKFGTSERRYYVVFLTLDNINDFFRNTSTSDYAKLRDSITYGRFNNFAKAPFSVYNVPKIVSDNDLTGNYPFVREIVQRSGAYVIEKGHLFLFGIAINQAHFFVPTNAHDKAERIERFQKKILADYERFVKGPEPK